MEDKEIAEIARDIGARLFALQAGLMAVIATHPNPKALRAALQEAEDAGMSNMLYVWGDPQIAIYRDTIQTLAKQTPR